MFVDAAGNPSAVEVWRTDSQWGKTTVLGAQSDIEYAIAVKAGNQANVETGFGPSSSITTLPGVPTCSLLGDIDQDDSVAGPDIPGDVRPNSAPPPPPAKTRTVPASGTAISVWIRTTS